MVSHRPWLWPFILRAKCNAKKEGKKIVYQPKTSPPKKEYIGAYLKPEFLFSIFAYPRSEFLFSIF